LREGTNLKTPRLIGSEIEASPGKDTYNSSNTIKNKNDGGEESGKK
jgi:hypothetical protein